MTYNWHITCNILYMLANINKGIKMTVNANNELSTKTFKEIAEDIHQRYANMGNGIDNFKKFLVEYPRGTK